MNLYDIAKVILAIEGKPISKVKFAKTVYFAHKELIRNGLAHNGDFAYIRMPLGPVPDGFMELADNHSDIIVSEERSGLSYNSKNYSLKKTILSRVSGNTRVKDNSLKKVVSDTLDILRSMSTSQLVERSHEEPSWKKNLNGNRFYISDKDMALTLFDGRIVVTASPTGKSDDEYLQASLIRGMIDDIVSESTNLEYPT